MVAGGGYKKLSTPFDEIRRKVQAFNSTDFLQSIAHLLATETPHENTILEEKMLTRTMHITQKRWSRSEIIVYKRTLSTEIRRNHVPPLSYNTQKSVACVQHVIRHWLYTKVSQKPTVLTEFPQFFISERKSADTIHVRNM